MSIQIGDRVRDMISGFAGIVTGKTEYLNGCRQFSVSPEQLDKDGKPIDALWIDEQSLSIVKSGIRPNPFATAAQPAVGGPNRSKRVGE